MTKYKRSQSGFSALEAILIVLVLAALALAGWLVWDKNKKDTTSSTNTNQQSSTKKSTQTQPQANYLTIKELGIRLKLTSATADAYYVVGSANSVDKTAVRLSTRALDAYPACKPTTTEAGVAVIGSFKQGESSPVEGDFITAYPKAPKISDKYYYISGDQYDCTKGAAADLHDQVRKAFIDSYSTIEKL